MRELVGSAKCVLFGFDGPLCTLFHLHGGAPAAPAAPDSEEEELRAAPHAYPTAYADRLVRTLAATGHKLAVVTDRSPQAVQLYLATRRLDGLFAGRIHGRDPDVPHPKPDPHTLLRALESTRTHAHEALLIGDAPAALAAAGKAGVPFLGYGPDERRAHALRDAGAADVTESLREVLLAVDPGAHV